MSNSVNVQPPRKSPVLISAVILAAASLGCGRPSESAPTKPQLDQSRALPGRNLGLGDPKFLQDFLPYLRSQPNFADPIAVTQSCLQAQATNYTVQCGIIRDSTVQSFINDTLIRTAGLQQFDGVQESYYSFVSSDLTQNMRADVEALGTLKNEMLAFLEEVLPAAPFLPGDQAIACHRFGKHFFSQPSSRVQNFAEIWLNEFLKGRSEFLPPIKLDEYSTIHYRSDTESRSVNLSEKAAKRWQEISTKIGMVEDARFLETLQENPYPSETRLLNSFLGAKNVPATFYSLRELRVAMYMAYRSNSATDLTTREREAFAGLTKKLMMTAIDVKSDLADRLMTADEFEALVVKHGYLHEIYESRRPAQGEIQTGNLWMSPLATFIADFIGAHYLRGAEHDYVVLDRANPKIRQCQDIQQTERLIIEGTNILKEATKGKSLTYEEFQTEVLPKYEVATRPLTTTERLKEVAISILFNFQLELFGLKTMVDQIGDK